MSSTSENQNEYRHIMYHIVVCIKAVPDPKQADQIRIDPVSKTLNRCDVPLVSSVPHQDILLHFKRNKALKYEPDSINT